MVDPYRDFFESEADLVLVTHGHEGHFDPDALETVCGENTCLVVPESLEDKDLPCQDVEYVKEDEMIDVYGIQIHAVPMYNEHHPQGEGVGYLFHMADTSIYIAGDTGVTKESAELESKIDLAFIPVDGVYTMDVDEAVRLAVRVKPKIVVPYHYGKPFFEEKDVDLRALQAELEDRSIECRIIDI